jgi:peptidoglycan LD-endopeptidase LytH
LKSSLLLLPACLALLVAACDGSPDAATDTPPVGQPTPAATATPEGPDLTIFRGFTYPITGACLPQSDLLMPNAPRDYRSGTHEGVDFYGVDNCLPIERGTPSVSVKDGVVIRADHEYTDLTAEQLAALNERIAAGEADAFDVLDAFRGRQVWVDHGGGIITRYAHLDGIAEGVERGSAVLQGQTIGFVGNSGTPESIGGDEVEMHLHWEFWVGDTFLGEGLPPDEVRTLYENLFTPLEDE